MSDLGRANVQAAVALVDELARAGVRDACVSPGSRSAPLTIALARDERIRKWIVTDERSAGFFALGAARVSGRPVALVCTSGTAAANYTPAVVEASLASIPLVVLTADRPAELRDCGAPQTIHQPGLFANHVRWETELATPAAGSDLEPYYRSTACRAVAEAIGGARGPVHVNAPFREPLFDGDGIEEAVVATRARGRDGGEPWVRTFAPSTDPDPAGVECLIRASRAERGAIVCGPDAAAGASAEAVVTFAEACGWPVLADSVSGLRHGPHAKHTICDAHDLVLRCDELADELAPEVLVRIGGIPSSKPLQRLLLSDRVREQIAVSPDDRWRDPFFRAGAHIAGDVGALFARATEQVASRHGSSWLAAWRDVSRAARSALEEVLASTEPEFEGRIVRDALAGAPPGTVCLIGNSSPIRDVDTFASTSDHLHLIGNRGANGIDGLVSTALGASAVGDRRVLLLIGDLSYLHDVGALQIADRHALSLTIVVVNNDGGRIFDRLPQGGLPTGLRGYFTTPHASSLPAGLSARTQSVPPAELAARVDAAIRTDGVDVLEVVADGEAAANRHREVVQAASRRMSALLQRAA